MRDLPEDVSLFASSRWVSQPADVSRRTRHTTDCSPLRGAFKFRGAANSVLQLNEEQAARGVVTHSSGNHAAALAHAAQLRGIPAHIVVPRNTPQCKVDAVRSYGGEARPICACQRVACAHGLHETFAASSVGSDVHGGG